MKAGTFDILVSKMSPNQRMALNQWENKHSELIFKGGSLTTKPLRVKINKGKKGIAAVNTRGKDMFLKLEFRKRDYVSDDTVTTKHRNFDNAYCIGTENQVNRASEIIGILKEKY